MIFVDTSGWVAAIDKRDLHHEQAAALLDSDRTLLTTNHVRAETWTRLRTLKGVPSSRRHQAARAAMELIDARSEEVFVTPEQEAAALVRFLEPRQENEFSYVDAISFVVMLESGISEPLTADRDFLVAGFVPLLGPALPGGRPTRTPG